MLKLRRFAFILIACLAISQPVSALQVILDAWSLKYPASTSDDAGCQLCHVNPQGNSPWNAYGWDIRGIYRGNGFDLDEAFTTSATLNSDNDPQSAGNITEINDGTQPGWTVGANNTFYYYDAMTQTATTVVNNIPPINLPAGVLIDPGSSGTPTPQPDPNPSSIPRGNITIKLETIASGFSAPVLVRSAPNDNFLYVVEQGGLVQRVELASGTKSLFLDFSNQLVTLGNYDERGLLGFAFHPGYGNNNKVYTYISEPYDAGSPADFSTMPPMGVNANHQSVISEWVVANHTNSPATATKKELLRIDQPQSNHNGGMIEFGPDGYLYISLGDGGGSNDQGIGHGANGNGRDFTNPLGTILRIDVEGNGNISANGQYHIPTSNPFVTLPGLDEIYAYGFRNPFRFSFEDLGDGDFNLYVGDVGQNAIEEVDRIHSDSPGGNYGWNHMEGSFYFYTSPSTFVSSDPPQGVALPNLQDPITEYDHDEGVSVIGGQVYLGGDISQLGGKYVFAEWSRNFASPLGRLFYLDSNDAMFEFNYESPTNMYITGFGKDNNNELYVVGSRSTSPSSPTGVLKKITLGSDQLCVPIKAANNKVVVICL